MRPSSETVPVANGSAAAATCFIVATSFRAPAMSARWLVSASPSLAAKTTSALPLSASGKFWSSSFMARALWLPGASKSSVKVPPPMAARKRTVPMTRIQVAIVRQGRLALAIAMPRVNLSMILPFEGAWALLMDGS